MYKVTRTAVSHPWMDDGDMHWGNTELQVTAAMRYGLELAWAAVPRQHCPCGWHGEDAAEWTLGERAVMGSAHRGWARHAVGTCRKGAGVRTRVHDEVAEVLMAMLTNAGFVDVKLEDKWWDVVVAYDDADHRRPDITCLHPVTRAKWVLDVVIFWGDSKGVDEDGEAGLAACGRENYKCGRYARAMQARQLEYEAVVGLAGVREGDLGELGAMTGRRELIETRYHFLRPALLDHLPRPMKIRPNLYTVGQSPTFARSYAWPY
eukprot:SAG31_NODE_1478_length_8183_cov_5.227992_7_plen_263_part_00